MKNTLSIAVSAALMSMSAHSAGELADGVSKFDISPTELKGVSPASVNKNKNQNQDLKNNVTQTLNNLPKPGTKEFDINSMQTYCKSHCPKIRL